MKGEAKMLFAGLRFRLDVEVFVQVNGFCVPIETDVLPHSTDCGGVSMTGQRICKSSFLA